MRQVSITHMSHIVKTSVRPFLWGRPTYLRSSSTHSSQSKRTRRSQRARFAGRHWTIASSIGVKLEENRYHTPPGAICDIVEASPEPAYAFSPCRSLVLQLSRPVPYPSIAELARSELKLAGNCFRLGNV